MVTWWFGILGIHLSNVDPLFITPPPEQQAHKVQWSLQNPLILFPPPNLEVLWSKIQLKRTNVFSFLVKNLYHLNKIWVQNACQEKK